MPEGWPASRLVRFLFWVARRGRWIATGSAWPTLGGYLAGKFVSRCDKFLRRHEFVITDLVLNLARRAELGDGSGVEFYCDRLGQDYMGQKMLWVALARLQRISKNLLLGGFSCRPNSSTSGGNLLGHLSRHRLAVSEQESRWAPKIAPFLRQIAENKSKGDFLTRHKGVEVGSRWSPARALAGLIHRHPGEAVWSAGHSVARALGERNRCDGQPKDGDA
jgi:hypothetical protein